MQVKDVMQSPVITIAADASLDQALANMDQYRINHLPVLHKQALGGLLTRRALGAALRNPELTGSSWTPVRRLHSLRVMDVMQRHVRTLPQEALAPAAAQIVWEEGAPCVVVVRDRKPLGMVHPTDLLDVLVATIDEQQRRKYKRLLVPTHFSPSANHAVRKGLELTRQHEASLVLLHVKERLVSKLSPDIDPTSAELVTRLDAEDEDSAMARLLSLVPTSVTKVSCEVVRGEPATEIVKAASRYRADLMVMGHSKRQSWRSLFVPNVSRQVARRAPCPGLVVAAHARYELVGR